MQTLPVAQSSPLRVRAWAPGQGPMWEANKCMAGLHVSQSQHTHLVPGGCSTHTRPSSEGILPGYRCQTARSPQTQQWKPVPDSRCPFLPYSAIHALHTLSIFH